MIQNVLNELLSHPLLETPSEHVANVASSSVAHLNFVSQRQHINQQIQHHRGLSAEDHVRMSNKLDKTALSFSVPEVSGLYHVRRPELNQLKLFFSGYETEKPAIEQIQVLPDSGQAFYEVRHIAKRGRDVYTDVPIEGDDSSAGKLKTSPYLVSQTAGSRAIRSEAATSTVDRYTNVGSDYLAQLHAHVLTHVPPSFLTEGGKVHLVRPTRDHYASDATLNFLTFCTQTEIARTLNNIEQHAAREAKRPPIKFTDYKSCVGLSRTARTEASPIGRLVQQAYFVTDDIELGDQVVIVDDHVQAGGSILAMAAALKEAGANTLGLCTLTTHPYSQSLALHSSVKEHMLQTLKEWDPKNKVMQELQKMGLSVDTLTNAEALILIAYATNPNDGHAVRKFKELEHLLISHLKVMDGEHDSLGPILNEMPSTPDMIVADIQKTAKETRKNIQHTPVTRVEVLDWDCCLTNEKAMNYELMVNALAVAAHEYAHEYPELQAINKAVRPYIHGEGYQEGMPKLCMGADRFTEFGITHPEFWKRHMPIELLDNLHTIAPSVLVKQEHRDKIISILQYEFKRQYKVCIRPPVPKEVQDRMQAIEQAKGIGLPFKNVELKFMPGAKEFLEQHRKPNTRLLLISNKGDHDLHNEVNKLAIAHYFDHISGVETVFDGGEIKTLGGKPKSDRLKHALEKQALSHRSISIRLVGDQPQDIMQGEDLLVDPRKRITGLLVAPAMPADLVTAKQKGIPVQYLPTLEHVKTQFATLRSKR